jgi:hypothetical protein
MGSLPVFVGLDYHDSSVCVCVPDTDGSELANADRANDWEAVAAFAGRFGRPVRAAVESCCGTAESFHRRVSEVSRNDLSQVDRFGEVAESDSFPPVFRETEGVEPCLLAAHLCWPPWQCSSAVSPSTVSGSFCLAGSFHIAATQGKGVWNRQAAVADFDPAPQLDGFWSDALKPFRAVPRKDFGFKVIVRVVEEAPAEAGPKN